jgi:quercetin dioxygenase-like cupin family protein
MKNLIAGCTVTGALILGGFLLTARTQADEPPASPGPMLETLLSTELEGIEGTDIIVSRVVMPPQTELPKHWHPGEEFAYVLEGSTVLRRDGKADRTVNEGELVKISLREVHTAVTTGEGATILVFRVHEHGQPERVLAD